MVIDLGVIMRICAAFVINIAVWAAIDNLCDDRMRRRGLSNGF